MPSAPGHRLCAAFWDTLKPLISNPRLPSVSSTLTARLSQKRFPISTHRPRFFTSSSSSTASTQWYPRSRYVVSRGFAGFCVWTNVSPTAASETTSCAVSTADRGIFSSGVLDRRKITRIVGSSWVRSLHYGQKPSKPKIPAKRNSSWAPKGKMNNGKAGPGDRDSGRRNRRAGSGRPAEEIEERESSTGHSASDNIVNRHRLSKDEMLAAATGFFQRLRIRTKWLAIRQMRPYNLDDIGAFFSWLFLGHVLWVVLGTTTFVSLTIFLCNTVFAQETLAGAVGNYLTKETGVKVVFESAIVPRWKDGCISFKNVFVARRPGHGKHGDRNVQKGSSVTAAAAAAAAVHADDANSKDTQHHSHQEDAEEEDTNYTQFDVTIDTINVTLSFAKWMNGKGLLKDVEIKGVRGVIDRTHVVWDDVDPRAFKYEHQPGDFEIDSFKLEDLLVTVHQPDGFRPFSVSIFSCDLPQLRKQWLFYDLLSANMMSGSFDDSLFTIHPRQTHVISPESPNGSGNEGNSQAWKKTSRLRIDGLEIDHLNRGVEGPFSWIHHGNADIVADIMFPTDDDLQFTKVVQHIVERMEATVSSSPSSSNRHNPSEPGLPKASEHPSPSSDQKFVIMDLRIQLNDVRAAVPLFSKDLTYVNSALVRPIVAYINSRRTYIPINCRVIKRVSEFDGSWTMYDSGLVEEVSAETYAAFARNAIDHQARRRRFKKVGLWSLQLAAQALLMAMAGNIA